MYCRETELRFFLGMVILLHHLESFVFNNGIYLEPLRWTRSYKNTARLRYLLGKTLLPLHIVQKNRRLKFLSFLLPTKNFFNFIFSLHGSL